jgi:hypothetical protein
MRVFEKQEKDLATLITQIKDEARLWVELRTYRL